MKMESLSASRIKTYKQCPMKYFAQYDLCLPEPPPHPLTLMGSAIHRMFENATHARKAHKVCEGVVPVERQDPLFHKAEAMKEFAVDPSLESLVDELTANALRWGYFRNIEQTKGCELGFEFLLTDGTPVKGFIDRLDVFIPNAEVIDLKTQKNAFSADELTNNWQAKIYNCGSRVLYPEVLGDITVSFWVLRHMVQKIKMTMEDTETTRVELQNIADEIRDCDKPECNPSGLCPFCVYCEQCPASKSSIRSRKKVYKKG